MLACTHPAFDGPVILFQDVIEILHRSMSTLLFQNTVDFELKTTTDYYAGLNRTSTSALMCCLMPSLASAGKLCLQLQSARSGTAQRMHRSSPGCASFRVCSAISAGAVKINSSCTPARPELCCHVARN